MGLCGSELIWKLTSDSLSFGDLVQVHDVTFQVMEGDARSVLCDAVEKHHASVLVVGSHGNGAIKRYALFTPFVSKRQSS